MELNLSLPELVAILDAERERQHNQNRFMASLKGIDLDKTAATETAEERVERIKNRVAAQLSGQSVDEYEFGTMGMGFEEEE